MKSRSFWPWWNICGQSREHHKSKGFSGQILIHLPAYYSNQFFIFRVKATDSDGTAPGNEVKYEIIGDESSEKASTYFGIDPDSGDIKVLNDLTKEVFDEYRLEIKAFDQGLPSLESILSLIIRVQQVVTMPPELGMVSHKMTIITIFGHKHFKEKFDTTLNIKWLINFEQNNQNDKVTKNVIIQIL